MAPLKQHMYQHLRSAKAWLTKAEEAFDKQHDIRGELDLMLAQAELQHVKEVNRSRQWRYKYIIFRHGLALLLAMFMVVVLGGVYWWTTRPELVLPVPLAQQANLSVTVAEPQKENFTPIPISQEKNLPEEDISNKVVHPSVNSTPVNKKPEQREKLESSAYQSEEHIALSADEMRKLVRAAGKSLRGQ